MRRIPRALMMGVLWLLLGIHLGFGHTEYKILVFSKTEGYRHGSIPSGIEMIQNLGAENDFQVDLTEDSTAFTDTNLVQYKAVVFLSTTGDVLNTNEQAAFERYIEAGHGYVGIHSATDTEYDWPWYGKLVGAYFNGHTEAPATIVVADRVHPSTEMLPQKWQRYDEWYNFQTNPRTNDSQVHVLATIDEKTYFGGTMGFDHPIAWCHEFDGGRAWYTAGGHTDESYSEPLFQAHVLGGIEYAAGVKKGESASVESNFQLRTLDTDMLEPMSLTIAPDGRVFYIERNGRIKIYDPATSTPFFAGQLPVFYELEDGLLGIVLDPDFMTNHWIYLMYSPLGTTPEQLVSRFTVVGNTVDFGSEKVLLHIPTQRNECCHSAGSLAFGPDGTLYISTGDNTNPFESDNYAPLDERPGRSPWDSQKSASNANDLRGKILRIHPEPDGTYTVPAGNLFPGGVGGKPEIYIMGCRNPYRISIDPDTGWLYWGEVGPDAYDDLASRGPRGYDEINQARSAGNYGWPYFIANNKPYRKYNFATGVSGPAFNPNFPTNSSPNNTGVQVLPPARGAWIWYPYGPSTEFPEMDGEPIEHRTAMAGPVYHFNTNVVSPYKLPAYYDKTLFIYELSRIYIKEVKMDDNGNILKINPFMPNINLTMMDIELGPDGALYMLTWFPETLKRIEYVAGNNAPVAVASATPASGSLPLTVQFSSIGSYASGTNGNLSYAWSFFGNGVTNSTNANPQFTYSQAGSYNAQLTVTDYKGNQAVANVQITAGNNRPTVVIDDPPNGAVFDWGRMIHYRARTIDAEDGSTMAGTIPCSDVLVESSLGHNEHAHSDGAVNGCEGAFQAPVYNPNEIGNVFLKLDVSYTDKGAVGTIPLRGVSTFVLQPRRKEAEYFTHSSGVAPQLSSDPEGGRNDVGSIDTDDWISLTPVNLTNITSIICRVAATNGGGSISFRLDSVGGTELGSIVVPDTGGLYTNLSLSISNTTGTHELFLKFTANGENAFVLNWIQFQGNGVNLPIFLQSSGTINGLYTDDPSASFDHDSQTISLPVTNAARFYRLRSGASLKIENIHVVGTNAVMSFR